MFGAPFYLLACMFSLINPDVFGVRRDDETAPMR